MEVIWGHKICILYTYIYIDIICILYTYIYIDIYKLYKLTKKYNVSTYFVLQLYQIKPSNWIYIVFRLNGKMETMYSVIEPVYIL